MEGGRSPDVAIPRIMELADEKQTSSFKELHIVGEVGFDPGPARHPGLHET